MFIAMLFLWLFVEFTVTTILKFVIIIIIIFIIIINNIYLFIYFSRCIHFKFIKSMSVWMNKQTNKLCFL